MDRTWITFSQLKGSLPPLERLRIRRRNSKGGWLFAFQLSVAAAITRRSVADGKQSILDAIFVYIDPQLNRISPAQPVNVSANARA